MNIQHNIRLVQKNNLCVIGQYKMARERNNWLASKKQYSYNSVFMYHMHTIVWMMWFSYSLVAVIIIIKVVIFFSIMTKISV